MVAGSVEAIAAPVAAAQARRPAGYGALVADPAGLLALPEGFAYQVVAQAGVTTLESGEPTPSDADGTACFRDRGGFVLVNNHEIDGSEPHKVPTPDGLTYDPGAGGGTTNIVVDHSGRRVQKDHGYVFEVDPLDRAANRNPVALRFLGRYAHEAVAVDPHDSTIYLTEDAGGPNGLYYRWTPPHGFRGGKGALKRLQETAGDHAGQLRAMSCFKGSKHIDDLSEATRPGTKYRVTWVDVPDRLAAAVSVRKQFAAGAVTNSRKLEGAYWGDGGAYFVASFARNSDGSVNEHDGQVWFYDPRAETADLKTIFGVNPDPDADTNYDGPDNITVSPHGGLILAEDGEGLSHLVGVTEGGTAYALARNELNESEFTGPTFSQNGRILFANIQTPGYVFAITGTWAATR